MIEPIDEQVVLLSASSRISELIRSNDLTIPVDHLPAWKIRDVVAHLGGVHRWAARIVTSRSMDGPSFTKSKLDGAQLCDWFDAGVPELLGAFQANDHDEACANFCPGSTKTVAWWLRRQMHETTVHCWDIERALDRTTQIDSGVAIDGVDEFLDVFVRTRGKQTLASTLVLTSTNPSRSWTLTPAKKPGRVDIDPGGAAHPAAELAGPPDQLILALWNRLTLEESGLTLTGDRSVAASLFH